MVSSADLNQCGATLILHRVSTELSIIASERRFFAGDLMSAWIRMISDAEASGILKKALDGARTPHGTVDNVLRVHSLRPATMHGHITLYRSVLHNRDNKLPLWQLEVVGTYVSILNNCDYSVTHHSSNLRRLLENDERANEIMIALRNRRPHDAFQGKVLAMLKYAEKLTLQVGQMVEEDYDRLKKAGLDDGEVLELNQVAAYFCYVNRLLNGLGVTTEGDVVGFY